METNRYPLANDLDGSPIEVPAEAVAWRVRRRAGKQGRPQCVYDRDTGAQLEIPIDATIDDLREYGPGVYRLDAVDAAGKMISGAMAQTEVPVDEEPQREVPDAIATLREVVQLLRHSVDTNCRAVEAMASAFGPMRPAQPQPVVVMGNEEKQPSMAEQMTMIGSIAQQVVQAYQAIQAAKSGNEPTT